MKIKYNQKSDTIKIIIGNIIVVTDNNFKPLEIFSGNINMNHATIIANKAREVSYGRFF